MADLSKLKPGRLGNPPSPSEASQNLFAPELAPEPVRTAPQYGRRDGRSARRTRRTLAFATKVTAEFDNQIRDIADRDNLLLVEVLERALQAYEAMRVLRVKQAREKQADLPLQGGG